MRLWGWRLDLCSCRGHRRTSGAVSGGGGQREVTAHLAQGQGGEWAGWGNSRSSLPFSALRLPRRESRPPDDITAGQRSSCPHLPCTKRKPRHWGHSVFCLAVATWGSLAV